MLELLLFRPAGRPDAIPVHSAEPPFWVHLPDGYFCGSPGLGLKQTHRSYEIHVTGGLQRSEPALIPSVPNREVDD
jgi:hypothetical protein